MTSWNRLEDVLPAIQSDGRIAIDFVIDRGSKFAAGLPGHLMSLGIAPLSWRQAQSRRFDLVLAAHANRRLFDLPGPLVLLPHGAGYSRIVPWSTGDETSPVGLASGQITGADGALPRAICLSHAAQLDQLIAACPDAAERGVVIGDPTLDRMTASRHRRPHYRRLLGVEAQHTLVVLTSTWGLHSAVATAETFVHRLAAQLPSDEFRLALVLHPNIWTRHSMWTIRRAFRDPLDAGMVIIPPDRGWQAAVLAADIVIGDHGSVASYAAAQGIPLLLAATGLAELDPHSHRCLLSKAADRIDPHGEFAPQLRAAITRHDTAALTALTELTFGRPGECLALLQRLLYQVIELDPPRSKGGRPRMLAVPDPRPERGEGVTAYLVSARTPTAGSVELARYPAIMSEHRRPDDDADLFTVVEDAEVDIRMRQSADVFVHDADQLPERTASTWIKQILDEYPGTLMAAARTRSGCLIGLRDGTRLQATGLGAAARLDPGVAAAATYGRLTNPSITSPDGVVNVRIGPGRCSIAIRAVRHSGRSP